mmetsp:Transcript_9263/g.32174  ORF Transcript_9263/g.32174 Transcript_9263/m.32174 type:complete len:112 (+) Transcript_9263:140-475(+)
MVHTYQKGTLGQALSDTLDELVTSQLISAQLAIRILDQFDESVVKGLSMAGNKTTFKGKLATYQGVDDVWTLSVRDCTLRTTLPGGETVREQRVDNLRIVASDAKLVHNDE